LAITPQTRIPVAVEAVYFRENDSLAAAISGL